MCPSSDDPADRSNEDPKDRVEISHISDHGVKGSEGTHEISQRFEVDGGEFTAFTDVSPSGDVGESGFDDVK